MKRRKDPLARLMDKVMPIPECGCWIWMGSVSWNGYGRINELGKNTGAHRYAYELFVGKIPDGLDLDHKCRVRSCVNPDHLEPVTRSVNLRRGVGFIARNAAATHCPQGHEYTPDNIWRSHGGRECKKCKQAYHKRWYEKNKHTRYWMKDRKSRANADT